MSWVATGVVAPLVVLGPPAVGLGGALGSPPANARRIINEVPAASRVPFRYTINAYRGCSHACTYCLVGETPVLLADGSTRPLADLRAGDAVYGISQQGAEIR